VAAAYAGVLWFGLPGASVLGPFTVMLGLSGVFASACIYRVPSRPAWNTWHTLAQFMLTAAALGPLFAAALGTGNPRWLAVAAATLAGLKLVLVTVRFLGLIASDRIELRGTARLLSTTLKPHFILRGVLLIFGGIVLPLLILGTGPGSAPYELALPAAALVLAAAGEILDRYLFFVSTVPTHLAAPYVPLNAEAA
jgi:formate dehydrogenase iron-sulfur subunit